METIFKDLNFNQKQLLKILLETANEVFEGNSKQISYAIALIYVFTNFSIKGNSDDTARYSPRGLLSINTENDYKAFNKYLLQYKIDIEGSPITLVTNTKIAILSSLVGLKEGLYTGDRLDKYISLNKDKRKDAIRIYSGREYSEKVSTLSFEIEAILKKEDK